MTTQKDFVKTALRVPRDMHAALHDSAKEMDRTFNAEILYRLRSTFKTERNTDQPKGANT